MINILISRPYFSDKMMDILRFCAKSTDIRLLIDCGAFTEFTQGLSPFPIEDYIAWLNRLLPELESLVEVDGYLALDVIGNARATMRNYDAMLEAGLSPIPIMTRGVAKAHVKRMVKTAPKIALGGIFGTTVKERSALRWMIEQLPAGYPTHWLGFTDMPYIRHYRPTSFDSSNWASPVRWGRMSMYDGNLAWGRQINYARMPFTPAEARRIRSFGFDPEIFRDPMKWKFKGEFPPTQCLQDALYVALMQDLRGIDVEMYFALSNSNPRYGFLLLHHYAMQYRHCVGLPTASQVEDWMARFDTLEEVTPASVGVTCVHA